MGRAYSLVRCRTVAVEEWLRGLSLAPGPRRKSGTSCPLYSVTRCVTNGGQKGGKPDSLGTAVSKRQSIPDVLTAEEIRRLLAELDGPAVLAWLFWPPVTGLRASELLALKWEDVDFERGKSL